MTPKDRMKMLSSIWTVFTVFGLLILIFGEGIGAGIVLLGLALMTLLATLVIAWSRTVEDTADSDAINVKAKRSDMVLIDRLIDSMNDAELAALKKRLSGNSPIVGDDGELVAVSELDAGPKRTNHKHIRQTG